MTSQEEDAYTIVAAVVTVLSLLAAWCGCTRGMCDCSRRASQRRKQWAAIHEEILHV